MEKDEYFLMVNNSLRRVRDVSMDIKRFMINKINWDDRLIAICGARGTGKTTMILQHIKERFGLDNDEAIYVSLDNLWFKTHSIIDLVEEHYNNGGTHIFIDEVHYQNDWQLILKNIYDDYPDLHIVYTGSSLLKIDYESGDLSRRQITYKMPGLSFREYLLFEGVGEWDAISLQDILKNHVKITSSITENVRVLKYFNTYLESGYYPFYKEVHSGYNVRITQVINQILESDYPAIEKVNYSTIHKIKKMLYILAQSCPQTPNMSELYVELETDRNQGMKMLYALERADLLNLLSSSAHKLSNMSRPDKIYCDNTNIMYSLTESINLGTVRETFFLNQFKSAGYDVEYPKKGDFLIDGKYLFEVGGKKKSFDQIKDIDNSYIAFDDVEIGIGNKIPLWLFGFVY